MNSNHPAKRALNQKRVRSGISMLELVIAGSMLAGVMTSLSLVLRTARQSWETVDADYASLHQMQAVGRHFVRAAREANGVQSITPDGRGITLSLPNGETLAWQWRSSFSGQSNVVTFLSSATGTESMLARNVDALRFRGFRPDGVTPATTPDDIQVVDVRVTVAVPRSATPQRSLSSKVWIRSW